MQAFYVYMCAYSSCLRGGEAAASTLKPLHFSRKNGGRAGQRIHAVCSGLSIFVSGCRPILSGFDPILPQSADFGLRQAHFQT
jgi:hypothetical protein